MYEFFRKIVVLIWGKIKFRVNVLGRENIPAQKGGYIIACNHQRYSDPPLIASQIKGRFSFMAKSELFEKNALFTWLIKRCGAFPVSRGAGDTSAIDRAISDIEKGKIFVIFPEGTRSKDGTLGRGKSGVALIAAQANAPILPVCIRYSKKGRKTDFAVGKLIPASEIAMNSDDRHELKRVTSLIMGNIQELQDKINAQS